MNVNLLKKNWTVFLIAFKSNVVNIKQHYLNLSNLIAVEFGNFKTSDTILNIILKPFKTEILTRWLILMNLLNIAYLSFAPNLVNQHLFQYILHFSVSTIPGVRFPQILTFLHTKSLSEIPLIVIMLWTRMYQSTQTTPQVSLTF